MVIDFNLFWLMGFMASSLILGFLVPWLIGLGQAVKKDKHIELGETSSRLFGGLPNGWWKSISEATWRSTGMWYNA